MKVKWKKPELEILDVSQTQWIDCDGTKYNGKPPWAGEPGGRTDYCSGLEEFGS